MKENGVTRTAVVTRLAARAIAEREAASASEVRRLLDAALELIRVGGAGARPRVADIVAAAGLSNDAFYRHFPSKDALIAALIEDGAERVVSYVEHRMARARTPEEAVRCWVEAVLSQADDDAATTTRAVLWNAGALPPQHAVGAAHPDARLAALLLAPLTELGSTAPEFDSALIAHAVVGRLIDHLWGRGMPTAEDIDRTTAFCLRAITPGPGRYRP